MIGKAGAELGRVLEKAKPELKNSNFPFRKQIYNRHKDIHTLGLKNPTSEALYPQN